MAWSAPKRRFDAATNPPPSTAPKFSGNLAAFGFGTGRPLKWPTGEAGSLTGVVAGFKVGFQVGSGEEIECFGGSEGSGGARGFFEIDDRDELGKSAPRALCIVLLSLAAKLAEWA